MQAHHIIKRPILTEKTTFAMNERKQFTFMVDPRASKTDIKKAIEEIYKVRVVGVNTQIRKGKERRLRTGVTTEPTTKKATIRLHPEDTIELF